MDTSYDVIVIGSGFGGPVAARKCAENGLKTLMIERSEKVGEKVISGLTIPIYGFLFGPAFVRDGNPPVERPVDGIINYIIKNIDTHDIEIDDSLMIPRPFSPIIAFGYNAYCMPFCEWEARKAVEAGAELLTSTAVTDVIVEGGAVSGVVLEGNRRIRARVVIDAEGSQGLVAVKAGVRKRYPPETISLADTYDYLMPKDKIDKRMGYSIRFSWGWDEQRIAPPLGHGNGLMVWPYRESLHFMQDQCLRLDGGRVVNLRKAFDEYHTNITTKLPWWTDEIAPHITLRARMWEGFEIFVGLDDELRAMPNHTDGMILIGDAAGLESTELCDGVPAAWFSAEIAADVAIKAVKKGDCSARFLSRYDRKVRRHPIIRWSIRAKNRYNLRKAQESHDEKELRKYVHQGWGLAALTEISTPLLRVALTEIVKNPRVISAWPAMFFRYYHNWHHERFDYGSSRNEPKAGGPKEAANGGRMFAAAWRLLDVSLFVLGPVIRLLALVSLPFAWLANPLARLALPVCEPLYLWAVKKTGPAAARLSDRLVAYTVKTDPSVFRGRPKKGRG